MDDKASSDDKEQIPSPSYFPIKKDDPFPFLKLPYFALRKVVHQIHACELVDLASCSKKSLRIVQKLAGKRLQATFKMNSYNCFRITFPHQAFDKDDYYSMFRFEGFPYRFPPRIHRNKPLLESKYYHCKNLLEGCLYFSGHLITMFGTEAIEEMQLTLKTEADFILLVDWLQKWKPTIKSFEVIGEDDSLQVQSKLVESLLQNLNVTENLEVLIPSSLCTVTRKLTLKNLELQSTCTYDSMLNIDSENVEIGEISCEYLNKFLLNWKNGGFQKLKKLGAKFKLDWAVLTNGITKIRFRNIRSVTYFSMENVNGGNATIKVIPPDPAMECYREKIEFVVQQEQPDIIEL